MKLAPNDGFYYYYDLAKEDSLQSLFSISETYQILQDIDELKSEFRYESDKWSIKQVIGHITDHERIKMFRAFQLSRNEKIQLWGYDQNSLVNNSQFDVLSIELLLNDLWNTRKASLSFIKTLSKSQLHIEGYAGRNKISLDEFLRSIVGHERHHLNILKQKYVVES